MKKIINGKTYNTETAEMVASYSNGGGWRDFRHYEESLYKKKTGEFFLFGEGGAMTKYSERISDNSWGGGNKIIPLSEDKAKKWMEEYADVEDYIKVFGEPEE